MSEMLAETKQVLFSALLEFVRNVEKYGYQTRLRLGAVIH